MHDLVIRSRRAVTAIGERPAAVCVTNGVITSVTEVDAQVDAEVDVTDEFDVEREVDRTESDAESAPADEQEGTPEDE